MSAPSACLPPGRGTRGTLKCGLRSAAPSSFMLWAHAFIQVDRVFHTVCFHSRSWKDTALSKIPHGLAAELPESKPPGTTALRDLIVDAIGRVAVFGFAQRIWADVKLDCCHPAASLSMPVTSHRHQLPSAQHPALQPPIWCISKQPCCLLILTGPDAASAPARSDWKPQTLPAY